MFRRNNRGLRRYQRLLPKIKERLRELESWPDEQLATESRSLRFRARSGDSPKSLRVEAFALTSEAAFRQLKMRPYDVQLLGALALSDGVIAEMQTGEGKTLTATLPLYLQALNDKGSHLATANDYLSRRDAEWMRPVFESLGLSVGVVQNSSTQDERRSAYHCDVTYGTAREFGFDFLRDRLLLQGKSTQDTGGIAEAINKPKSREPQPVQRGFHFALIDEADSILIDEARMPLIISAELPRDHLAILACYRWAAEHASTFVEREHFERDERGHSLYLTEAGMQRLREINKPEQLDSLSIPVIVEFVERAIRAHCDFLNERHYVVQEGKVVIVDEFSGRLAVSTKWKAGLHQAVEAKEGVDVTLESGVAAQVTLQQLFSLYDNTAGMTGTAESSAREFSKIYQTPVVPIPTNKPCQRALLNDRILHDQPSKWLAIRDEVKALHDQGRPVLIGTRSIDKSKELSSVLEDAGIEHRVLNAYQLNEEAEIVAEAGQRSRVTVATNMAGRGTDIQLGEGVMELGGLHVIGTELHESQRIDRQLSGRCSRQGDPGSFRQYLALDDDILTEGQVDKDILKIAKRIHGKGPIDKTTHLRRIFDRAQRKVEKKYFRQRRVLTHMAISRMQQQERMGMDPYLDTVE